MVKRLIEWAAFVSALFCFSNGVAGTNNYRSLLVGERAVALGGAYTALSNTSEGGVFNPAGLAFVDSNTLSVAGNFYSITRGKRKGALTFAGDTADLSQNSFNVVPQIASYAQQIRLPWDPETESPLNTIGLNVAVVDYVSLSGRVDFDVAGGQALLTREVDDQTLYVGPSFARRINDRLSWGVSLFYVLRMQETTGFIYQDTSTTLGEGFLDTTLTVGSLRGLAGVRYSPYRFYWIGVAYHTPTLKLHGKSSRFFSAIAQDKTTNDVDAALEDLKDLEPNDSIPHQISIGLAHERPKDWTISTDVLIHLENEFHPIKGLAQKIKQEMTVNFSVGGEYYLTEEWVLRSGFFTNLSSAPDITTGAAAGQSDKIDYYGISFAGALERKNTTLSLGTVIRMGRGDALDNLGNKISVTENSYMTFLAGSYKF